MKKILTLIFALLTLSLLALAVGASDVYVLADDQRELQSENDTFYLPSYILPSNVRLAHDGTKTIEYENADGQTVALASGTVVDLTPFKSVTPAGQEAYILNLRVNGKSNMLIFHFASNLPSVFVETTLGKDYIAANNAKDEQAFVTVINKDGTYEYVDNRYNSQIKVRGNATKAYAKKPFQIKLDTKADLFDMGESKTWLLLANYDDQSLIRNSIMYKLGELLGMHTTEFQMVDLFLDGEYYGVYLLCEKVSISSARLNIFELEKENDALNPTYSQAPVKVTTGIANTIITEYSYIPGVVNPADITGGYLIELDNNYWRDELCYFVTENGSHYVVKSPEYASKEQVEYIATLIGEMEEAMMAHNGYNRLGKHYTEYVDINSFVYAYIMAEFGRNYDAGSSSMYLYKDIDKNGEVSKIYKGPLWDCDNTLGNIHKNGASNPEGYWAKDRSIWGGLTKHSEFNDLVSQEFARIYDTIFDMIDAGGYVSQLVDELGQSIFMERARWHSDNYSKWPVYYDGTHYDRWQSQAPIFNFVSGYYSKGYNEDSTTVIGYLCEHIEARANWLATDWNCNVQLRERSFTEEEPIIPEPPESSAPESSPSVDSYPSDSSVGTDSTVDSQPVADSTPSVESSKPNVGDGNSQGENNDGTVKTLIIIICVAGAIAVISTAMVVILLVKKKK